MVVYGYETWSLVLREEQRLRLFKNRVLRILDGSGMKLREVGEMYPPPSIIRIIESRRMRWEGHLERMERRERGMDHW
jgi:hypothetical protein